MKLRAKIVYGLSVLCAVLTVACSAGTPSENDTAVTAVPTEVTAPAETSTATVAPTVVPTAAVTPTVTVMPTATITPTPTPTEAKVFEIGSAEWLARNRELHEIVNPTKDISLVGTGKGTMPEDGTLADLNNKYGISRIYTLEVESVGLGTDVVDDRSGEHSQLCTLRVSGLRDQAVADKIHDRIDEIVYAMGDPCYMPDVPGFVRLLKQYGPAENTVVCESRGTDRGYLGVVVKAFWKIGDDVYSDGKSVCFNLATGEELRLSDFFREGEDYIAIFREARNRENEESNPFANDYWFFQQSEEDRIGYDSDYDDEEEYDGGSVRKEHQITGAEAFTVMFTTAGLYCSSDYGFEVFADWDPVHALKTDKEIYATTETLHIEGLGYRYTDLSGAKYDSDLFNLYRRRCKDAEKILVPTAEGKAMVKVVPAKLSDEWSWKWNEETAKSEPQMSEQELEEATKQWVAADFPKSLWAKEIAVVPAGYSVYPNGFGQVFVNLLNAAESDYFDGCGSGEFWVKDGVYITEEELFDVSYEELLTELFGKVETMTPENSAAAAKALAPYVVGLWDSVSWSGSISFDDITYTFGRRGEIDHDAVAPLIEELSKYLPLDLINEFRNMTAGKRSTEVFDAKVFIRHLRMLEGYPLE